MPDAHKTICAIATPPGRGGVGIVRISGPQALEIAKQITCVSPKPRFATYCMFNDERGNVIDDGILLYFPAPASFTGEDVIELQGHGGRIVLNLLLNRIIELGAEMARPGEFTERAFLNNKLDLIQAEAVADLIDSVSEKAARSASRSLQGEFSRSISEFLENLINLRVYVEGALDFPEEEIDFFQGMDIRDRVRACLEFVENILARARCGKILNEGVQIAILGRPNVGKSSLLNRLSGSDRAIVTDVPGTTRDVIEDRVLINGISVTISDTAGIRETEDIIEQEGINRAIVEAGRADIILLVVEYGEAEKEINYLKDKINRETTALVIKNKIDLSNVTPGIFTDADGTAHVSLSARTGQGIELLEEFIYKSVIDESHEEDAILARSRHIESLLNVKKHLEEGLHAAETGKSPEILAAELNEAQRHLAVITGEYAADDLLGEIFSRFCIGK